MKPVTFNHNKADVIESCDLKHHLDFVSATLVYLVDKIVNDKSYNLSMAVEELLTRSHKHLKMDVSMPIMDEEVLPVYLALKLGEMLKETEHNPAFQEAMQRKNKIEKE